MYCMFQMFLSYNLNFIERYVVKYRNVLYFLMCTPDPFVDLCLKYNKNAPLKNQN